ncbi:MAG: hypothetical protein WDW38_009640 [Sanguina aurantia]
MTHQQQLVAQMLRAEMELTLLTQQEQQEQQVQSLTPLARPLGELLLRTPTDIANLGQKQKLWVYSFGPVGPPDVGLYYVIVKFRKRASDAVVYAEGVGVARTVKLAKAQAVSCAMEKMLAKGGSPSEAISSRVVLRSRTSTREAFPGPWKKPELVEDYPHVSALLVQLGEKDASFNCKSFLGDFCTAKLNQRVAYELAGKRLRSSDPFQFKAHLMLVISSRGVPIKRMSVEGQPFPDKKLAEHSAAAALMEELIKRGEIKAAAAAAVDDA